MLKILVLSVICVATTKASQPIEYEHAPTYPIQPKLISQSVHLNEVPTKIIKITRTVAVKVPVPYPVKVPHHIPVPVPVHHPVAVPVPQIVKVPHHVPVEVSRPVPVELPQQVPLFLPKAVALPHPVPVPQPVAIHKPVYYPVPHPVPYPVHEHDVAAHSHGHHIHAGLFSTASDFEARESADSDESERSESQHFVSSQPLIPEFRPSQPDYANAH